MDAETEKRWVDGLDFIESKRGKETREVYSRMPCDALINCMQSLRTWKESIQYELHKDLHHHISRVSRGLDQLFDIDEQEGEMRMNGPSREWVEKMAEIEDGESVSVGGLAVDMHCYSAPDPRTRFQKLRDRLFPSRHCFAPEAPSEFKDCIHGRAITKLSWTDRFRVLLTGVVVTSWRTVTENEVGRTVNAATCHIGTAKDLLR